MNDEEEFDFDMDGFIQHQDDLDELEDEFDQDEP